MIRSNALKTWFLTGLLVLMPLAITLWVLSLIIGTMDQSLALLPAAWQPVRLFGLSIPGLGAILTLIFILLVGMLAHNFIGQRLVSWWEALLRHIPVVGPIYSSVKQVSDTLLSSSGNAFRKALLVQYPRQGSWTIAFLTGRPGGDVQNHLQGDYVSVYVPTTPNPTSGFFLMMPRAETIELDMSVDTALKYIVSMGVVSPADLAGQETATHAAAQAAGADAGDGGQDSFKASGRGQ
ncbi:DUF502 domain-containing protein [Imbroritus primus]|uniref:DUF502 domain-containing protein n=1 Tax=Imbroritus primus TaxID=3058603 RepID=A0ACD3SM64_9BURK|nr:DUF502 domain-containing protein [Burkholderiaceae bacterium PBA]